MIKRFARVQNLGPFRDTSQPTHKEMGHITAIYGENGRGKSTLVQLLRSAAHADAARMKAHRAVDTKAAPFADLVLGDNARLRFDGRSWQGHLQSGVHIFDSEFVARNVCDPMQVTSAQRLNLLSFALGEDAVNISEQISQMLDKRRQLTRQRTNAIKFLDYQRRDLSLDEFLGLAMPSDLNTRLEEARLNAALAHSHHAVLSTPNPEMIAPISFDTARLNKVLSYTLPTIATVAQSTLDRHIAAHESPGFEDWLRQGIKHIQNDSCPFCGKPLDNADLIQAYQARFTTAYCALAKALNEYVSLSSDAILGDHLQPISSNRTSLEAWQDDLDIDLPGLDAQVLHRLCSELASEVQLLAHRRLGDMLTPIPQEATEHIEHLIEQMNQIIDLYNLAIKHARARIDAFKHNPSGEAQQNTEDVLHWLEAVNRRFQPDVVEAARDYVALDRTIRDLSARLTHSRDHLCRTMKQTLTRYEQKTNELLCILGADFGIKALKQTNAGGTPRTTYTLRLKDKTVTLGKQADAAVKPCFGSTISDGDKRTLALAFFLARLETHADQLGHDIIVLDDPTTSLDDSRRDAALERIAQLADSCDQLILLSHDGAVVQQGIQKLADLGVSRGDISLFRLGTLDKAQSEICACTLRDICSAGGTTI